MTPLNAISNFKVDDHEYNAAADEPDAHNHLSEGYNTALECGNMMALMCLFHFLADRKHVQTLTNLVNPIGGSHIAGSRSRGTSRREASECHVY